MFKETTALITAYVDLKDKLISAGFQITDHKEIDYGVQFNVSKLNDNGVVRIYFSKKKGLTYDTSQVKDGNLQVQIENFIITKTKKSENLETVTDFTDELFNPVIGTDESGKGDYFGPLVAAGVFVNKKTKPLLEKIGVRDSKKISDEKIFELAESIKKICANQYAIIEISPERYNNLYNTFKNENKNLNTLLAWAHAKAIEEVLGKVDCDNALSDKFADEKFIISKLQEKGKKIILRQQHKAETNIAVAAASILARSRFLEKLRKLSQEYNIALAKGASDLVIEQAKAIINLKGKETLGKIAKLHFKTTKSVIK
ncbi:MAG TPA: ribonuclease HIII [Ignavibacteriaceae bacterium]|nr:ribonuclease HIII [Ignavibacteriaceae bacterium]